MKLFDTHAHLDFPDLAERLDEVIETCRNNGVMRVVTIGASRGYESNERALDLARTYPDFLRATAGIHPHDAGLATEELIDKVDENFARLPEIVAIGETGLDYYYDKAPREVQQHVFRRFLRISKEVQKPVVIHSRDADEDTVAILEEEGITRGILHCFTGSRQMAERLVESDLDFYVSFTGIVTFKNGRELLDIAAEVVPEDRILVETDSPYLAPVPYRGKRNEPGYVRHTAEVIAQARGVSLEEFAASTWENACRVYAWPG